MLNRLIFLTLMLLTCFSGIYAGFLSNGKMYIDQKEMCSKDNTFRIHIGGNEWIQTNTMHRDETGLFTFENDIFFNKAKMSWEKQWKCPYCFQYWPMGKPCGNSSCPSKFR